MEVISYLNVHGHDPETVTVKDAGELTVVEFHTPRGALRVMVSEDGYYNIYAVTTRLENHEGRGADFIIESGLVDRPPSYQAPQREIYRRLSNAVKRKNAPGSHEELMGVLELARQAAGIPDPQLDANLASVRDKALADHREKRKAKARRKTRKARTATTESENSPAEARQGTYPFSDLTTPDGRERISELPLTDISTRDTLRDRFGQPTTVYRTPLDDHGNPRGEPVYSTNTFRASRVTTNTVTPPGEEVPETDEALLERLLELREPGRANPAFEPPSDW